MSQHDIRKSVSLGACAVALASGIFLGHQLGKPAQAKDAAQLTAAATAAPAALAPSEDVKRYKIPVSSAQPSKGPQDALVTIVEWCDFPDPGCAAIQPALQGALARNPELVRLVFRHFGRPENPSSSLAQQFLAAAFVQGKFWEVGAMFFQHKGELTTAHLQQYAGQAGLDWDRIDKAIANHDGAPVITSDRLFASMFDVTTVPAVFVNGRPVKAPVTAASLNALVEEEIKNSVKLVAGGVPKADIYAELIKKGVWTPLKREQLVQQP